MTPEEVAKLKIGDRVEFAPDGELHSRGVVEEDVEMLMKSSGVYGVMVLWDDNGHRSLALADGRGTLCASIRKEG